MNIWHIAAAIAFLALSGGAFAQVSGTPRTPISGPTSTLTRPADTTAYASGDLIASSTTAGSIVVPSFSTNGTSLLPTIRLRTNVTTGWGVTLTLNIWSAAPTYTNGDNGAYAVATGSSGFLGSFSCALTQFADGASGVCTPSVGNFAVVTSGAPVYWDLQTTSSATPISGQTFTVTAGSLN